MFKKKLLALLGGAMALTLLSSQPVFAQDAPEGRSQSDEASGAIRGERVLPGRLGGGDRSQQNNNNNNNRRQRRPAEPTPEQNKATAQTAVTAAGLDCQVTEAKLLGSTADQSSMYEAVCAKGPGYMVLTSTPPQTFNCLELAGQAETNRARDPNAEVGQQCSLPANLDAVPVVAAFARDAGIACTVDQGAAIGRLDGNLVYEVGCAGADGFQLEQKAGAWGKAPCWARALEGASCRYTTPDENLTAWKTVLAGTEASACTVQQARKVGADAQGLVVYEVKCDAADGYFVRVNHETFVADRVHACAAAAHIAGGCTLTPVAPAAAPTEQ